MLITKFIVYFRKKAETIINVAISDMEYFFESHSKLECDKFESVISGYLYEEIERWVVEDDFIRFPEKWELTDEDIEAAKQVIRDWNDEAIQDAAQLIYKKVIADPRFQKIAKVFDDKFYRPIQNYFDEEFYDDLSKIIKNCEVCIRNDDYDDYHYHKDKHGSYRFNKNGHLVIRIGNWHCSGKQMEAIDNEFDPKISRLCGEKSLFSCDVVYDSDGYAYLDVYIRDHNRRR